MTRRSKIYIVHLRRPRSGDPRWDPFYELGSFGCTGCHSRNLLNSRTSPIKDNDRLAFIQGGPHGSRLVMLTPPVKRKALSPEFAKGVLESYRPADPLLVFLESL